MYLNNKTNFIENKKQCKFGYLTPPPQKKKSQLGANIPSGQLTGIIICMHFSPTLARYMPCRFKFLR